MTRNKKTQGKKKLDSPITITNPSANDIVSTKHAVASTSDHTTTSYSSNANAARTVYDTVELLEMVLIHLPTKTLGRSLSVSKHCRTVILGNQQLRQRLFLEPTRATEYLETDKWIPVAVRGLGIIPGTTWVRHEAIFQELRPDSQDSRIIVEAHPILEVRSEFKHRRYNGLFKSLCRALHDSSLNLETDVPFIQTMPLFCEAVKMVPAQTPLFQPPVTEVKMYHHGALILLRCSEGLTFGTVAEQFEKMDAEYDQHFRKRDERIIQDFLNLPHIPVGRQASESAIEALKRLHSALCAAPCLCFEAEGAIFKDSEHVRVARTRMD